MSNQANVVSDMGFTSQPFQSGDGKCYPISYKNYYNMRGGSKNRKQKGGKNPSYTNGMNCPKTENVPLNMRENFGPFLYPPTEFAMNPTQTCGGRGKKSKRGGSNVVGSSYATEKLIPFDESQASDLDFNGQFTDTRSNWKQELTGEGGPATPGPSFSTVKKNNLGCSYATASGGRLRKNKKQKGGDESWGATSLPQRWFNPNAKGNSGPGCTNTAYGETNAVSGACRNLAPCPSSTNQQTGGDGLGNDIQDYSGAKNVMNKQMVIFKTKNTELSDKKGGKKSNNKNMKGGKLSSRRGRSQSRSRTNSRRTRSLHKGGNGTLYVGAPGCNKTTNMDNNPNYYPQWSLCNAGGKKSRSPKRKTKSPKRKVRKSKSKSPKRKVRKSKSRSRKRGGAKKSKSRSARKARKSKSKSARKARKSRSKSARKARKSRSKSARKARKSRSRKSGGAKKSKSRSGRKARKSKSPKRKARKSKSPKRKARKSKSRSARKARKSRSRKSGGAKKSKSRSARKTRKSKSKSPKRKARKSKSKSPKRKARKSKSPKKGRRSASKKKLSGGASSDWRSSLYSRGPSNNPGQNPAQFKQMTKTGEYISNRDLWTQAAPQLTGAETNQALVPPVAFNAMC